MCSACNVHAPYGHLSPVRLCNILLHDLIFFSKKKKKIIEYKLFVPIFFLKFCLKHFVFLEELSEILLKMYIGLHVKYLLLLSDFNETWIFSTDFRKKTTNIKFNENPSCGSRVIPCGRTDRHDEDNSRFL